MNRSETQMGPAASMEISRRSFIQVAGVMGGPSLLSKGLLADQTPARVSTLKALQTAAAQALNLAPAKWLWYPGDRTLPNTFVLFRRALGLSCQSADPVRRQTQYHDRLPDTDQRHLIWRGCPLGDGITPAEHSDDARDMGSSRTARRAASRSVAAAHQ